MSVITGLFQNPTLKSMELALDMRAARHQAIASNIANINTPEYKRVDVSEGFQDAYRNALRSLDEGKLDVSKPAPEIAESLEHGEVRKDGNNVDMEKEMVLMMSNRTEYEFAAEMLARNFRGIKTAIGGGSNGR